MINFDFNAIKNVITPNLKRPAVSSAFSPQPETQPAPIHAASQRPIISERPREDPNSNQTIFGQWMNDRAQQLQFDAFGLPGHIGVSMGNLDNNPYAPPETATNTLPTAPEPPKEIAPPPIRPDEHTSLNLPTGGSVNTGLPAPLTIPAQTPSYVDIGNGEGLDMEGVTLDNSGTRSPVAGGNGTFTPDESIEQIDFSYRLPGGPIDVGAAQQRLVDHGILDQEDAYAIPDEQPVDVPVEPTQPNDDWVWYDHDNDPSTENVFGPDPSAPASDPGVTLDDGGDSEVYGPETNEGRGNRLWDILKNSVPGIGIQWILDQVNQGKTDEEILNNPPIYDPDTGEVIDVIGDNDGVIIGDNDGLVTNLPTAPEPQGEVTPPPVRPDVDVDEPPVDGDNGGVEDPPPATEDPPQEVEDPVVTPPLDDEEDDGIDVIDIIIGGGNDDNDDPGGDDVSGGGVGDFLKDIGSSVSSVLQTDVGNSSIGDILGGGINFYGQKEAAEAAERAAEKGIDWQKEAMDLIRGDLDPFKQMGYDAIPGAEGAANTTPTPDPRLGQDWRLNGSSLPTAWDGYKDLPGLKTEGNFNNSNLDTDWADWQDKNLIREGSEQWDQLLDDATTAAQNWGASRGKYNTQETKDSALKSMIRAMGEIEGVNQARIGQELGMRGDTRASSGQMFGESAVMEDFMRQLMGDNRKQVAAEQLSESQTKFQMQDTLRKQLWNELAGGNQGELLERGNYWNELIGADSQEFQKLLELVKTGQNSAAQTGAASAHMTPAMLELFGGLADLKGSATGAKYESIADLFGSVFGNSTAGATP